MVIFYLDECIWGSADKLLRIMDDKYCWQPERKTFSYIKRNLTTSHVHAMLSAAIYSVMDKGDHPLNYLYDAVFGKMERK